MRTLDPQICPIFFIFMESGQIIGWGYPFGLAHPLENPGSAADKNGSPLKMNYAILYRWRLRNGDSVRSTRGIPTENPDPLREAGSLKKQLNFRISAPNNLGKKKFIPILDILVSIQLALQLTSQSPSVFCWKTIVCSGGSI